MELTQCNYCANNNRVHIAMDRLTDVVTPLYHGILDGVNVFVNFKLLIRSTRIKQFVFSSMPYYGVFCLVNVLYYVFRARFTEISNVSDYAVTTFWWLIWTIPVYVFCGYTHYKASLELWRSVQSKKTDDASQQNDEFDNWAYWSEVIYGALLSATYSLQYWIIWAILYYIVRINVLVIMYSLISFAWMISWGVFDYRLIYEQKPLFSRIRFFERRWLYFLGYGLPVAVAYTLVSWPIRMSMWYPAMMFLSIRAVLVQPIKTPDSMGSVSQLRLFYFAEFISTYIITRVMRYVKAPMYQQIVAHNIEMSSTDEKPKKTSKLQKVPNTKE